jgi:tetratricopeptide (TPR) repeat protein
VELVSKRLSDVASDQLDPAIARQSKLLCGDLDTIVAKALKKKPSERYANAESMAVDLRHWLAHEPITARPDTRFYVLRRFVRRHRWSVAASSAAVLALVGLTGVSVLQARRAERAEHQAQERRQQADDLLSYMLGEFADKLRPIGRLDLLDSVGSKALTYLAQDDKASPQERLQRAKALTVIGEVRVSRRALKEALEPLAAARKLLEGPPPTSELTGEWLKAKGAAAFWTGHVHYYTRELDEATAAWLAYRDAEQAWVEAQPDNREAKIELSYAYNSLGTARLNKIDLEGAASHFRRSIELKRQNAASAQDPSARMDLADSLSWLGNAYLQQGLDRAAERMFSEGAAIIADVRAGAPSDNAWAYREAIMRRWRADALFRLGRRADAMAESRDSLGILSRLQTQDPTNLQWRFNLLIGEVVDLDIRSHTLPAAQRLAAGRELLQRLNKYVDEAPKSRARSLDTRARLISVLVHAMTEEGDALAATRLLDETAAATDASSPATGADLTFTQGYIELRRARLSITPTPKGAEPSPQNLAACQQIDDAVTKIAAAIRVHQQITQAWIEAQSCLGHGEREDVKRAAAWLLRDRSGEARP